MMKPVFVCKSPLCGEIKKPTPAKIKSVLARLVAADPNADYLILDKKGAQYETVTSSYIQTRPHRAPAYEGVFVVEYRDGGAGRHYKSHVMAGDPLVQLFASYLADDEQWKELAVWRDTSYDFPDLRDTLPPEESAASFFSEGEYEKMLKARKQGDQAFWKLWREKSEKSD